jgi:hypothetical protein
MRQFAQNTTRAEFVPVIRNVRRIFAEGFERVYNEVDAVVTAVLVTATN